MSWNWSSPILALIVVHSVDPELSASEKDLVMLIILLALCGFYFYFLWTRKGS